MQFKSSLGLSIPAHPLWGCFFSSFFVMSFCRQIPGCFLSPTGANCSTESTVGQPLISATWDSQDESLCQHLTSIPILPGSERRRTLPKPTAALSSAGTLSTGHDLASRQAGSRQNQTTTWNAGHWVLFTPTNRKAMHAAWLLTLRERCEIMFSMLNGLKLFYYILQSVYFFKLKLCTLAALPN